MAHGPAVIARRDNSWRARYRGPDRRERSKSFQRTSDAERWLVQQRSLVAQGDWTDPAQGRIIFGEYAEAWLEARADLKPKTRHQYQSLLRQHIMPTWRTVPLGKITFKGLTHWIATELAAAVAGKHADQLVFTMPGGSVMRLSNWRRITFMPARGRAGVSDRFRIHDLRHSAVSLMIQAATRQRCCRRSSAMPALPPRWTCTGIYTPAR